MKTHPAARTKGRLALCYQSTYVCAHYAQAHCWRQGPASCAQRSDEEVGWLCVPSRCCDCFNYGSHIDVCQAPPPPPPPPPSLLLHPRPELHNTPEDLIQPGVSPPPCFDKTGGSRYETHERNVQQAQVLEVGGLVPQQDVGRVCAGCSLAACPPPPPSPCIRQWRLLHDIKYLALQKTKGGGGSSLCYFCCEEEEVE